QATAGIREMLPYQEYPLLRMIENMSEGRDMSRNPLFDIVMSYQDISSAETRQEMRQQQGFVLSDLDAYLFPGIAPCYRQAATTYDLTFNVGKDLRHRSFVEIVYNTHLFDRAFIDRLFEAYQLIIAQVLDKPQLPVGALQVVPLADQHKLVQGFNDTATDWPV